MSWNCEFLTNAAPDWAKTILGLGPIKEKQDAVVQERDLVSVQVLPPQLSFEELITAFWDRISILDSAPESSSYGKILREAEKILLELETSAHLPNEKIQNMRTRFQASFQLVPAGPGQLTQLDIDHLKTLTIAPKGVICLNKLGIAFRQPELSVADLTAIFYQFGFSTIMYERKLDNFENENEICDVILLGKKWSSFFKTSEELIEESYEKLQRQIVENGLNKRYQDCFVGFTKDLEDQAKANRLIKQGLPLFVALFYPKA